MIIILCNIEHFVLCLCITYYASSVGHNIMEMNYITEYDIDNGNI